MPPIVTASPLDDIVVLDTVNPVGAAVNVSPPTVKIELDAIGKGIVVLPPGAIIAPFASSTSLTSLGYPCGACSNTAPALVARGYVLPSKITSEASTEIGWPKTAAMYPDATVELPMRMPPLGVLATDWPRMGTEVGAGRDGSVLPSTSTFLESTENLVDVSQHLQPQTGRTVGPGSSEK